MKSTIALISFSFSFLLNAQNMLPTFDGEVSSEEWQNAKHFEIKYEIEPGNNTVSSHLTDVYVTYSKTDLYVGFIAYADMPNLRSSIRNRDEGFQDDFVMVGLDPYGDGRYMVSFGSNPEGNQLDLKFLANGQDDVSYNVSFESKASKHEDSYHVELKIPFSVLQFKMEPEMTWNILLYRSTYTQESRTQNFNFPIDRNNACLPCQVPTTITLTDIESKNRVSLLPYVYAGLSGEGDGNEFSYDKPKSTAGLSGLFDLSNTTSLEYAVNPDFSQVEADVSQVTANNNFAIFFMERRPYFNEGNDIIETNLSTVYTRSINKPLLSTKVISQGEKQRVYWLTAYDEESPYLLAGENRSYFGAGKAAYSNILRYQRNYSNGSNFGILTTNRFFKDGGYGHTLGLDGLLRFSKSYTAGIEYNRSIVLEPTADWISENDLIGNATSQLDGEKLNGDAINLYLRRDTNNWNSRINFTQFSPHYQTPLGFVTRNNIRTLTASQGYQKFFEKGSFFKQISTRLNAQITNNFDNLRKYLQVGISSFIQMDYNIISEISFEHVVNEEFEGFNAKNLQNLSVFMRYNPSESVSMGFFTLLGESLWYDSSNPQIGNRLYFETFNNFQITPKLSFRPSLRYYQLKNKEDGSFYTSGYIGRTSINFQFNKALSFRLIGEFNNFSNTFFYQPLFKWNPNPNTIFYIGGTNGYAEFNGDNKYGIENSQLYCKFQYQFDL